jgi:UDP-N-acetylglucosamine 2-epimerase (non-hydrolysing)
MLDQALGVFEILPDVDLKLMRPRQSLTDLTCMALKEIDVYLKQHRPELILVQGDTTTVFAAALAAFYQEIAVGHVEAGLRTGNMKAPWPEEANRILATRLANLHFAPTEISRRNLLAEGVDPAQIFVTGNTVIDALYLAVEMIRRRPPGIPGLSAELLNGKSAVPFVLITGHRRESFGEKLRSICQAIKELANRFPEAQFVYPVHLNPNVRSTVDEVLRPLQERNGHPKNIHLIEPLSYLPFVALMERSTLILTDSGGIQEEAPSLGKPVLVTRETTERPEALAAGTARLVGAERQAIVDEVTRLMTDQDYYDSMARAQNPYGDGKATERILNAIFRHFGMARTADVGTAEFHGRSVPYAS